MAGVVCGNLDLTKLPQDEIVTLNKSTWLKADVDEKFYIIDNRPYVVIKFSNACLASVCDDQNDINLSLLKQAGVRAANNESEPSEDGSSQSQTRSLPADVNDSNNPEVQAQSAVDVNSIDIYSWYGSAVKPTSAIIPIKSNVKTYGPYVSSNFNSSYGGTQVEVNPELSPWIFGSTSAMNAAGISMVESAAIGLVKSETGSVTILGPPLSSLSLLGMALDSSGPTLSSLNFSYGSGGVTTQYEFRTYTPKFGGLNRHLIDKLKTVSKNRIEQLRFLRNNQITLNKISRKIKTVENPPRDNKKDGGTLQRVLIGEMYDWEKTINDKYTQCSIVGLDTLRQSVSEMVYDYGKKAYISLDALYGPISKKGDGGLPRYTIFDESDKHFSSTDAPQPPFAIQLDLESTEENPFIGGLNQYNLNINQDYLDPLNNSFENDEHHHAGSGIGHSIDLVGRETQVLADGAITNFYNLDDPKRYSEDYRFLGMRGPILLHSWGYDTNGKPIPNASDTDEDTKGGNFTTEYLKDQFLTDWLGKPATWPVAPIDFRFDRKRGVWVCPPGYKVVVAKLDEKLDPYQTAKATLINQENTQKYGDDLYDKDGNRIEEENAKIKIVDRIGQSYKKNSKVYCYYDTYNSEYLVLNSQVETCIRFRLIDLCESSSIEPDYNNNDAWSKFAGYGDKFSNNHILGVRINCNGDPIDNQGNLINHEDIIDTNKKDSIFVNLLDTCGKHGPAYAQYTTFSEWMSRSSTGFAVFCSPTVLGSSVLGCSLGENGVQCSQLDPDLDSYDILFLDSYARFVECELLQKLYTDSETASVEYAEDIFKNENSQGNAAAVIKHFYGSSPNGRQPQFYDSELEELEFRVFDPFFAADKAKNPFLKLDVGDRVLAIFDENRKKYIIYNALVDKESIIKFALVDNKDIGDRFSRAVLVDLEAYPVDENGERLTEETFSDNFITVIDPFAIHGEPSYNNAGTTGFGPALGSDIFDEHMNGIILNDGNNSEEIKGGPFIGYAIRKYNKDLNLSEGESNPNTLINQIFFLETFAHTIEGKIASKKRVIDSNYYLGIRRPESYVNGRPPITRDPVAEDNRINLRVRFPLDIYTAGKYVIGDWKDSEYIVEGDPYNSIDGCKFVAILDHVSSKVNSGPERLYYNIIETEYLATRGKSVILDQEQANQLNVNGEIYEDSSVDSPKINSEYLDGFMWNKEESKTNYEKVKLLNRTDWIGRALIFKWDEPQNFHIHTTLSGFDPDGGASYMIEHAATIARVLETLTPSSMTGKLGQPGVIENLKINQFAQSAERIEIYHGISPISPLSSEEKEQPSLSVGVHQQWMTYEDSYILALWNENRGGGKISDGRYNLVYAREAPVIITGIAAERFTPESGNANIIVSSDHGYASCPGVNKQPVVKLMTKAKNPMCYGAEEGDFVTLQRVSLQSLENTFFSESNYYYMVIGTGGELKYC